MEANSFRRTRNLRSAPTFPRLHPARPVNIEDGAWLDNSPYGVVHRIASSGEVPGVGTFCITWAFGQSGHVRIDTHGDNLVMQGLLAKLGFTHTGTIHVREDHDTRLAYEKVQG